mmetsp:Transcript_3955/g.9331  ORF Transcript_3955/g.9331 Transcript_3955/m.9331 type:complete len:215 (+) Transcript_3955:235-879(+)
MRRMPLPVLLGSLLLLPFLRLLQASRGPRIWPFLCAVASLACALLARLCKVRHAFGGTLRRSVFAYRGASAMVMAKLVSVKIPQQMQKTPQDLSLSGPPHRLTVGSSSSSSFSVFSAICFHSSSAASSSSRCRSAFLPAFCPSFAPFAPSLCPSCPSSPSSFPPFSCDFSPSWVCSSCYPCVFCGRRCCQNSRTRPSSDSCGDCLPPSEALADS